MPQQLVGCFWKCGACERNRMEGEKVVIERVVEGVRHKYESCTYVFTRSDEELSDTIQNDQQERSLRGEAFQCTVQVLYSIHT
jgi:hypothetical protein